MTDSGRAPPIRGRSNCKPLGLLAVIRLCTQFVPNREARVYNCLIGPGVLRYCAWRGTKRVASRCSPGSTAPTMPVVRKAACIVWGAKAKPSVFFFPGGFAVNTRVERKCLMGRMNWSRIATRERMRRYGVEDINGAIPVIIEPPKQPRRKLSKAELRQQTAAAFLAWRARQTSKDKCP